MTRSKAVIVGMIAAGVALLYLVDPAGSLVYPPCPLHALTGLYCAGCGSLRAVHHVLHGDLYGAFRLNPVLVVALPLLPLLWWRTSVLRRPFVAWTAVAILLGFSIARNIPSWPFSLLAPR